MTTLATDPVPAHVVPAAPSSLSRTLRYAGHTTRLALSNIMFSAFTIVLPVGMYLLFSSVFGAQAEGAARGVLMVNMAAYGGLGAAVTAGTQVQEDQRTGFLRQLIVAGLSPRSFLVGSVIASSAVILPALAAVGIAGLLTGVQADLGRFLLTLAVLWLGLLPTILIGIALGMLLRGGAAMAGGVLTMMAMAIFGGLWMPIEALPGWMQSVGRLLPTYWIAELGAWALGLGDLTGTGLLVIGLWTVVLGAVCALGLTRAVGLKRR